MQVHYDFDGEAEMKTLQEVHDMLVLTGYKDEAESVKKAIHDSKILDFLEDTHESHGFFHIGYGEYRHYAFNIEGFNTVRQALTKAMESKT